MVYDAIIASKTLPELRLAAAMRKDMLLAGRLSLAQGKLLKNYVELRTRELTKAWASSSV